jgi:hypothetical protein
MTPTVGSLHRDANIIEQNNQRALGLDWFDAKEQSL